MKRATILAITALMTLAALPALAHSAIDKVIASIEKEPRVEYVAYNERRNPSTRKIYKSTKVIVIKNRNYIDKIIEAFRKEAGNSVSYEITRDKVYRIIFMRGSDCRSYTLVKQGPEKALLTVELVNDANRPKGGPRAETTFPDQLPLMGLDLYDLELLDLDLQELDMLFSQPAPFGPIAYKIS